MWQNEMDKQLKERMEEFHVDVPHKKLLGKRSIWQRLINYLASPVKNPLENIMDSVLGYELVRILPIVAALLLSCIPFL